MQTLDQIMLQAKRIDPNSTFWAKREVKQLPKILWENEVVEDLAQGVYTKGQGLLVATNKRLIFIYKGILFGITVEDFSYDKISSIQYHTGLFFGEIVI
jgi:hypothetical protein